MIFDGNSATLKLDAPAAFTGAIESLVVGDAIDLAGITARSSSWIKRIAGASSRFERVVTTLGIFFRCEHGFDGACIYAIRFARRMGRSTVIGVWCGAFASGGA